MSWNFATSAAVDFIGFVEPRRNTRSARLVARVMIDDAYDTPSEVAAEDGEVIVDGPDGVALSLTPEAALETSDRLLRGGLAAKGQQLDAQRKTPRPS